MRRPPLGFRFLLSSKCMGSSAETVWVAAKHQRASSSFTSSSTRTTVRWFLCPSRENHSTACPGRSPRSAHSDRREDGNPSLLGIDVIGVDEREGPAGAVLDLASDNRPYPDDVGRHLVVWQNAGALQLFDQFTGDVEVPRPGQIGKAAEQTVVRRSNEGQGQIRGDHDAGHRSQYLRNRHGISACMQLTYSGRLSRMSARICAERVHPGSGGRRGRIRVTILRLGGSPER